MSRQKWNLSRLLASILGLTGYGWENGVDILFADLRYAARRLVGNPLLQATRSMRHKLMQRYQAFCIVTGYLPLKTMGISFYSGVVKVIRLSNNEQATFHLSVGHEYPPCVES